MRGRVLPGEIDITGPEHSARVRIQGEQDVVRSRHLGDGEERVRGRVVGGCSGYAERVDVAARKSRKANGRAEVDGRGYRLTAEKK